MITIQLMIQLVIQLMIQLVIQLMIEIQIQKIQILKTKKDDLDDGTNNIEPNENKDDEEEKVEPWHNSYVVMKKII